MMSESSFGWSVGIDLREIPNRILEDCSQQAIVGFIGRLCYHGDDDYQQAVVSLILQQYGESGCSDKADMIAILEGHIEKLKEATKRDEAAARKRALRETTRYL